MSTTGTTSKIRPGKSEPGFSDISYGTKRKYRQIGMTNLLKMGHCAPAAMQSVMDIGNSGDDWLVRMTAGLPGGIGNTGSECGGITAPLIQLGLRHGLSTKPGELPSVIYAWHDYIRQFQKCNNGLLCREILGKRRVPLPCIKVVRHVPELYWQTNGNYNAETIPESVKDAYMLLYSHMSDNNFHCAHNVLRQMGATIILTPELLNGTSGFVCGTAFKGLTCSAYTAGLMAVGLKLGEIEDSYFRVIRMLATMIAGGNAFDDRLNKFNRLMNIGNRMSKWFANEFGSCICSEITGCSFSSAECVNRYIRKDYITTCKTIAESVAKKAESIINDDEHALVKPLNTLP